MKAGYKTTEFWLTLFANVAPAIAGALPPAQQAALGAATVGVYTIARTAQKAWADYRAAKAGQ